jgi:elongator complex protein 3
VVGLTIETRPDDINPEQLYLLRRLGCTKIQIGIQSLDQAILDLNQRNITVQRIQDAFSYIRLFGFKIHAHFMLNLLGSTPESDKQDYLGLVSDPAYLPDEIKLYPCTLVLSSRLVKHYQDGSWQPYSEPELIDVLTIDVMNTPAYTRISRMVRDIAAPDIVAGNKKTNLRQMVENKLAQSTKQPQEIRYREINRDQAEIENLALDCIEYSTTATQEYFLQWVTAEKRIVGFLRLSLPKPDYLAEHQDDLPIKPNEAMIREVHIYGAVARLKTSGEGAQHYGLGRRLIDIACDIAKASGYQKINVISSVGTREYYRNLGFYDNGLYQQREL